MNWMKTAGMTNIQILKASTINAAKAIGKEDLIGSIEVGKKADLLVLNNNPLDNLSFAKSIEWVMKDGDFIEVTHVWPDTPEMLAQRQLNGYNSRNIDAFLEPYAEDVKLYRFPDILMDEGKEAMRTGYAEMFEKTPGLHCVLENRIVNGNTIIDHELVYGFGKDAVKAIAIYKIEKGKIAKVYFIQ